MLTGHHNGGFPLLVSNAYCLMLLGEVWVTKRVYICSPITYCSVFFLILFCSCNFKKNLAKYLNFFAFGVSFPPIVTALVCVCVCVDTAHADTCPHTKRKHCSWFLCCCFIRGYTFDQRDRIFMCFEMWAIISQAGVQMKAFWVLCGNKSTWWMLYMSLNISRKEGSVQCEKRFATSRR